MSFAICLSGHTIAKLWMGGVQATHQAPEHFLVVLALFGLEHPRLGFIIRVAETPDPYSSQTCITQG